VLLSGRNGKCFANPYELSQVLKDLDAGRYAAFASGAHQAKILTN